MLVESFMHLSKLTLNKILVLALLITVVVNIEIFFGLNIDQINDRANYHLNVDLISNWIESVGSSGLWMLVIDEPIFKLIIYIISLPGFDSELTIKMLIALSMGITVYTLSTKTNISVWWLVIAMIFPGILVNYVMTLRQGLALSFFMVGYFSKGRLSRNLLIGLSALIHYSFFIIIGIYLFSLNLSRVKFIPPKAIVILMFPFAMLCGAMVLYGASFIGLNSLSDQYIEQASIVYFGFGQLFWLVVLILFLSNGNSFVRENFFSLFGIAFYIGSVIFFAPFSRIMQNIALFSMISGFSLTGLRLKFFKILIIFHILYIVVDYFKTGQLGLMFLL
jgi:hypothetical protein